jgi:predicted phage terminase large subunit-like protein
VWQARLIGIERGHILMTMGPILEKRIRETRTMMPIEELKPGRQDKIARARPIQARMQQKRVFFRKHCDATMALYAEMMRFPNGAHDDQVDSIAWIGQLLTYFTVTREKKQPPKRSWRDKLSKTVRSANKPTAMTS